MNSQILLVGVLASAVLGSGVGVVHIQHTNRHLFVQLQKLQKERDRLEIEWESLRLEQSTLITDAAVEKVARTRLNMVLPDPSEVFYITPE